MSYNPNNPNGQASPANSAPVVLDTTDSGNLASLLAAVLALQSNAFAYQADTYTAPASGTTVSPNQPFKCFSILVKGTGSAANAWQVVLEGSNDNVNFTTILLHQSGTNSDGDTLYSGQLLAPCRYFRSRCMSLTLGSASNIVVTCVGAI